MSNPASSVPKVDITNCDREPIHLLGTVQSHGVLLVCTGDAWRIVHASSNTEMLFGQDVDRVLGQDLAALIGGPATDALGEAFESSLGARKAHVFHLVLGNGQAVDASLVNDSGRRIVELEPVGDQSGAATPLQLVNAMLSRMQNAGSVEKFCDLAAERVRTLFRCDRVMIYKFLHDGAGAVIAEARRPDLVPFLGMRYPASDVPQQARALYLKSWIRLIADVGSTPVPIVPERDSSGQPVDLSFTQLRSVSPIHIEYLKNMGVGASMSISIVVAGKLWGLIACHHYSPLRIAAPIRASAELFGQIFSLQLEALEPNDSADAVRAARLKIDDLLARFPTNGSLMENLTQRLPELRSLVPCDGVGLWIEGTWASLGTCPPAREIPALTRFIVETYDHTVFATHELPSRFAPAAAYAAQASGLMTIPLSRTGRDYLMVFRKEVIHTVKWGGDPTKAVTLGPNGDRLTPRKSFDVWQQDVRGQSSPWTQSDRLTGEALRITLLEVVLRLSEVAKRERDEAAQRQRLLIAELNHRVKNVLALVNSLVARGQREGQTISAFVQGLQGRIRALAFAHDQAMQDGSGSLAQLIKAESKPYEQTKAGAFHFSGSEIVIDAHALSVLALVVHEMMTNAAKYGALSAPNGRLSVEWRVDASGDCVIDWQESGGPAVQAVQKSGFGTTLIDRQIVHELNGQSDVRFEMTGVRARFVIPAKHVIAAESKPDLQTLSRPVDDGSTMALAGVEILLVEDSLLIALDAEAMLQEVGAASVEVASSAEAALVFLAAKSCSVAVLDINLGRGTSLPVADELAKRQIPFIFASGYNDSSTIPERFRHIRIVTKPYTVSGLSTAISEVLRRKG